MFAVMVFPVLRFVFVKVRLPVVRKVMDPSAALRILKYSLSTGKDTPIWNPQKSAGRMTGPGGGALNCHLGPRARAGAAVTIPPNRHSSAPSATTAPSRLMAITSTRRDRPARRGRGPPGHRLLVAGRHGPAGAGVYPGGILPA